MCTSCPPPSWARDERRKAEEEWHKRGMFHPGRVTRPDNVLFDEADNPPLSKGALELAQEMILTDEWKVNRRKMLGIDMGHSYGDSMVFSTYRPNWPIDRCGHDAIPQERLAYADARIEYFRILFKDPSFGEGRKVCCAIEQAQAKIKDQRNDS